MLLILWDRECCDAWRSEAGFGVSQQKEDRPRSGRLDPTPWPDRSSEDARSPGPSEKRASNMQNRPANAGEQPATAFRSLVARQLRSGVLMFSGVES